MNSFKKRFFVLFIIPLLLSVIMVTGSNDEGTDMPVPQFVSAKPGPIEIVQPDGSKLTIRLFGDERFHYSQTEDGYTTIQDANGFHYYGELNDDGDLVMSDTRARNTGDRSKRENNFLKRIGRDLRYSERQMNARKRMNVDGENIDEAEYWGVSGTFPTTGNRKFLLILVSFTDKVFVKTQGDFDNLMNGASPSFKDYYLENSFNQLNIATDVVGPYNLSGSMATYGANDAQGYDINPRLMVQEGVDAAEAAGVDFSQYDNDGNGYVDGIMVVHAGYGEEAGAPAYTIWSHRWTLSSYARTYDGVTINDYTTAPELYGTSGSQLTGIGVIVHEFGHNLGAPDTYDTDYTGSGGDSWHMKSWDVMASGSWNNNGYTPANYPAMHRWQFGWQTPTTLDTTGTGLTLANSTENNVSYVMYTPTSGEYFMLENRQQLGYDAYLPGHGLLIYHIDENWIASHSSNNLNAFPTHQGIDIEEADNIRSTATYGGDPFPGTANVTSFSDTTTPSSVTWAGANTNNPITNIAENSGVISFDITIGGGGGPSYCASQGNNSSYEWISSVQLDSYTNTSGAAGYTDFTSEVITLTPGATVNVTLTPDFSGTLYQEYWKIWIDYNDDKDFNDSGEEVFSAGPSQTAVSGSFVVPAGAAGTTRMRVSMKWNGTQTACETFSYGEVEDYTVEFGGTVTPPVAEFSASATTINEGDSVNFTDLSTNSPTEWLWSFTGGTPVSSTVQNPSVTYNSAGVYTVSLEATNAGGSDTETKTNYITVNAVGSAPVADFTASATTVTEGQSIDFTDLSTNTPTSWSWTFEGGTPGTSTAQNPTITYNTQGTYYVELTAANAFGSDVETRTGYITVNPSGGSGLVFETGSVSGVGSSWQTVNLANTYTSPVVVCTTGLASSSTLPAVVRVRNAAGSSFDVMVQNPSGSALSGFTVWYTVVEEGVYTVANDGVKMEAVKVNSTVTAENNSWVTEARSYSNSYTTPVVLGQVMTYNDTGWSVFWANGSSRAAEPTSSVFNAGKEVAEDTDTTRANETIGYIVIEAGSGTINGVPYTAALGADTVRGPGNTSSGYNYTFSSIPTASVAIVSANGMDGGNGGWPVLYGGSPITSTTITLVFDEDQIGDSERAHTPEKVAYIVFGTL